MKDLIRKIITSIKPYDTLESEHIQDVLVWLTGDVEIFRIKKPDIPPKHLVSYFVLVDKKQNKLLLIHHKKSGLLLPAGGHVEKNEHPADTVRRELHEELKLQATFLHKKPLFLTVTETVNMVPVHTDVSLWYVLEGDSSHKIIYDAQEMSGYDWLTPEEILAMDSQTLDPHLHRFVHKLSAFLHRRLKN